MPKKTYTVYYLDNVPMVRLTGKWLQDIGINIGDKLKLIQSKNMIILAKLSDKETQQLKKDFEIQQLTDRLNDLTD